MALKKQSSNIHQEHNSLVSLKGGISLKVPVREQADGKLSGKRQLRSRRPSESQLGVPPYSHCPPRETVWKVRGAQGHQQDPKDEQGGQLNPIGTEREEA